MLGVRLHLYVAFFACIASGQVAAGQCVSSEKIDFKQDLQPGNRTYLGTNGLTVYEGSYIRNVLGISKSLNLKPIILKTSYDEFIKRRSTTKMYESEIPTPEFAVKFLNEHSGLLEVAYDSKNHRLQVNERTVAPLTKNSCGNVGNSKVIAAPIRDTGKGSLNQAAINPSTPHSKMTARISSDAASETVSINSLPLKRTTGLYKIHFETKDDETLKSALDRFSLVSNLDVLHEGLGFKDLNLMLDSHTYTADTYIEILKSLLAQHSILVSVED